MHLRAMLGKLRSQDNKGSLSLAIYSWMYLSFLIPQEYAIGHLAYRMWQVNMLLATLVALVFLAQQKSISLSGVLLSLFFISYLLVSVLANWGTVTASFSLIVSRIVKSVGFILVLEATTRNDPKRSITAFTWAGLFIIILHILTVLIYFNVEGGMQGGVIEDEYGTGTPTTQRWYLLTYDNESVVYYIPVFSAAFCYSIKYKNKLLYALVPLYLIAFGCLLIQQAVTASLVMGLFAVIVFLLTVAPEKIKAAVTFKRALIGGLAILALSTLLIASGSAGTIAEMFGKASNFSGRTWIWNQAIGYFESNPLFGVGFETNAATYAKILQTHCHNLLIQILYTGGVFSLVIYIAALFSYTNQEPISETVPRIICSAAVIVYLISAGMDWLVEDTLPIVIFYLPAMCRSMLSVDASKKVSIHSK